MKTLLSWSNGKNSARAFLQIVEEFGSFYQFIWSFVGGKPIWNS